MRPALLPALLLLPLALAPTAAPTHTPLCPMVDLASVGAGTYLVLLPPGAAATGFVPECMALASGTTLAFASLDLLGHPVGNGNCFFNYFSPTNPTGLVRTWTFAYDGATLTVNGAPCQPFRGTTTADAIEFPYFCSSHGAMQGRIRVLAS